MRDGNACVYGLCDDESMCRTCRVFGYGREHTLLDRLSELPNHLHPSYPLRYDVLQELRRALVEAHSELSRRRDAEERQARA
jgi:hypothetical protein